MASPPPQANPPLLHRFLGIGLVLLSIAAAVGKAFGIVPMLPPDDVTSIMGDVFSGLVAMMVVAAFVVFKPRVPERKPGHTVDAYWSTPDVVTKVMAVWFLIEGAGVFGIVGYALTGAPFVALAAAIAVAAFWMTGPNTFAKA